MRRHISRSGYTFPIFLVMLTTAIFSQSSGSLDSTFGSGGVLVANVPGSSKAAIRKVAIQTDRKIVALVEDTDTANNFRLAVGRFNTDGSLDTGFGTGGFVYPSWPTSGSPRIIAVQDDGKIVVGGLAPLGRNTTAMRFERYNSDGTPDGSFGSSGVASVNTLGATAMTIQTDGKILAMNADGQFVRLTQNGSLDSAFGSGGIASPKLALSPWMNGLLVLPSGKIIAAGHTVVSGVYQFTVACYNANGSLDDGSKSDSTPGNQFGSGGKSLINFPGYSGGRAYAVNLDAAGRLVVVGAAGTQNTSVALARLNTIGQLDTNFGIAGRTVFTSPSGSPQAAAFGIQGDGRIVVIGSFFAGGSHDAMLLRFSSSGGLDSFDVGQIVLTDTFGDEYDYDGVLQNDPSCNCERVLWAGASYDGSAGTPLMIRYVL